VLQKSNEWPYSKLGEAGILAPALMDAVISDIKSAGPHFKTLRIEAQDYTIPFYEKMGFAVVGDGFLEANIPHHAMEKCV
jgi:predicted GNAT family N-acyltransferase